MDPNYQVHYDCCAVNCSAASYGGYVVEILSSDFKSFIGHVK